MKKLRQKAGMTKRITFMVLVLLTLPALHALAGSGPAGLGGEAGAPIDGGISLLVAAGVGYGVKKARTARKKANVDAEVENK